MIDVKTYKKAYELILKKFNLKDIIVEFSNGKYEIRPCLVAISQDGCKQNMWIDDPFYNVNYAYVDELDYI